MKGVGVGDTAATPLAAAITWILKDGTGMIGRIVFAWFEGYVKQLNYCARTALKLLQFINGNDHNEEQIFYKTFDMRNEKFGSEN